MPEFLSAKAIERKARTEQASVVARYMLTKKLIHSPKLEVSVPIRVQIREELSPWRLEELGRNFWEGHFYRPWWPVGIYDDGNPGVDQTFWRNHLWYWNHESGAFVNGTIRHRRGSVEKPEEWRWATTDIANESEKHPAMNDMWASLRLIDWYFAGRKLTDINKLNKRLDQEKLLKGIQEFLPGRAASDPVAYGIFGDWLEDEGENECAAFLRALPGMGIRNIKDTLWYVLGLVPKVKTAMAKAVLRQINKESQK